MTQSMPDHRGPSGESPAGRAEPPGRAGDIVELIMADHRRIRRLRDALSDAARYGADSAPEWVPAHVWQRFTGLLAAHFKAEEEVCYLPLPDAAARRQAAADHDDIRDAIRAASAQRAGTPPWWRAVTAVLMATMEHLDREERGVLADCLARIPADQRRRLGYQWTVLQIHGHDPDAGFP